MPDTKEFQGLFEDIRHRFRGGLLGTFVGDALGMPLEGLPAAHIAQKFGRVTDLMEARLGTGTYTDDTEMTIALAEALVACRGFSGAETARRFLRSFNPDRGYGRGTARALERLREGVSWTDAGTGIFGQGSFGNGAAMRVIPIALLYHDDLNEVAYYARESARITHAHPLGKAGACVQALAGALALRWGAGYEADLTTDGFLLRIRTQLGAKESLFHEALENVERLLATATRPDPKDAPQEFLGYAEKIAAVLGNDARSFQSVPTALYAFLSTRGSTADAITDAAAFGGDTDTIAAMAGALAGTYSGDEDLPSRWMTGLEEGPRGRGYVTGLADDLFLVWLEDYCRAPDES